MSVEFVNDSHTFTEQVEHNELYSGAAAVMDMSRVRCGSIRVVQTIKMF